MDDREHVVANLWRMFEMRFCVKMREGRKVSGHKKDALQKQSAP